MATETKYGLDMKLKTTLTLLVALHTPLFAQGVPDLMANSGDSIKLIITPLAEISKVTPTFPFNDGSQLPIFPSAASVPGYTLSQNTTVPFIPLASDRMRFRDMAQVGFTASDGSDHPALGPSIQDGVLLTDINVAVDGAGLVEIIDAVRQGTHCPKTVAVVIQVDGQWFQLTSVGWRKWTAEVGALVYEVTTQSIPGWRSCVAVVHNHWSNDAPLPSGSYKLYTLYKNPLLAGVKKLDPSTSISVVGPAEFDIQ